MDSNPTAAFCALFTGSERSFATFRPSGLKDPRGKALGAYSTHQRAPTLEDYERHLLGSTGIVVTPIHQDGTTAFGVIDVDLENYSEPADYVNELRKRVVLANYPLHYFPSKSGGAHFTLFLDQPRPAFFIRQLLNRYVAELGIKAEVFPKQDQLSEEGKGSCVNLPFFGDRPGFEAWLQHFKPSSAAELEAQLKQGPQLVEPRQLRLPKLAQGVDFQAELDRVGLKYVLRETSQGREYNYHGLAGQGCLLKGGLHPDQRTNSRQSQFLETKNREVFHRCFDSDCQGLTESKTRVALRALGLEGKVLGVTDGTDWRDHCVSFSGLSTKPPQFLLGGLIPSKALTLLVASAYHGKTWLALQASLAIARGESTWGFEGPEKPTPVIYHVPEMNESLIHHYAEKIGYTAADDVLFRPMEFGLWPLEHPRMLESARGRLVVLDTTGYFNPADDANAYNQSLKFASLVYNLLNQGAEAVLGLYHVPKYSRDEKAWTLENSVLGSAGYGGILRSCLRLKNLNPDLNDPSVRVYAQGLKNPGLKPFLFEGIPLRLKLAPGDCPYLNQFEDASAPQDVRYLKATQLFASGKSIRDVVQEFGNISKDTVSAWKKRWEQTQSSQSSLLDEKL